MKRKWLYLGVVVSSILQFFVEWLWDQRLFNQSQTDLILFHRVSPDLFFIFLSKVAFACMVGFFYLHIPNDRRSIKTGVTIGAILGFLTAIYQVLGQSGSFNISAFMIFLEIAKTIILSVICGITISFMELRTNRRT